VPPRMLIDTAAPRAHGLLELSGPVRKLLALAGKIAADLLVFEYMQLHGRLAQLFDHDQIEIGENGFARPAHGWFDHPLEQHRVCTKIDRGGAAQ